MKAKILSVLLACTVLSGMSVLSDDAMQVSAVSRKLNFEVNFGISETTQYGVPGAFLYRFEAVADKVSNHYLNEFDIEINFINTRYAVRSAADACRAGMTLDTLCTHAVASDCSNGGPYHHSNIAYNLSELFPLSDPATPYSKYRMHITAAKMCLVSNGTHYVKVHGLNQQIGQNPANHRLMIRDEDYVLEDDYVANWYGDTEHITYFSKTLAHEIGHCYGVVDHYNIHYLDARDDCIYGFNKDDEDIAEALEMCSVCYSTILHATGPNHG